MEYQQGRIGRVFAARLRDGESIYDEIEALARRESIDCASVLAVGGIRKASVVTGPENPASFQNIRTLVENFDDAREMVGVGTLFLKDGQPSLHFHAAMGRSGKTLVGCPRIEARCFLILEVIIIEWLGLNARRELDPETGFHLLTLLGAGLGNDKQTE